MNGLRALASKENKAFSFSPGTRCNTAATIEVRPDLYDPGVCHSRTQCAVDDLLLAKFLERGGLAFSTPGNEDHGENRPTSYGTKLAIVATEGLSYLLMNKSISTYQDLVSTLSPDPLFNRILHVRYYPYSAFSGSIGSGGIATMRLITSEFLFMFSVRQHDKDISFDSRCVAFRASRRDKSPQFIDSNYLFDCLDNMKGEARSPLYLPFALSVYAVHDCRNSLAKIRWCVIPPATITTRPNGHFKNGYELRDGTPISRERGVEKNRWIMIALNHTASVTSILNAVESLWQYLEALAKEIPPSAKTEQVIQSTDNILEAIRFLRQEVKGLREALRDSEVRIRDQAFFISAQLSLRDSETNMRVAHASRDLAAAAQRDSSAMKSIAILTMSFLPGMFFAALFAMPYFSNWDQPRHFVLYWACTIPATLLTFAIWAALTQRSVEVRWMKMLCSNWSWGFWRGRRGKDLMLVGDEEKGKKSD